MKRLLQMLAAMFAVATASHAINQVDGVYQIGTADEMLEFVSLVNGGEVSASAVLTADVTVAFPDNVMIGVNGKDYKGTFDGQGHRLTATVNRTGDGCGLFANIASEGKVCNLVIDGTITGTTGTGSVAWQNFGTIENILSVATIHAAGYSAGITCASQGSAVYRNCIFAGTIDCGTASPVAGFSWWANGGNPSYENCVCNPQSVTAGGYFAWSEQDGNGSFTNCYYTNVNGTNRPGGAQLIDAAIVASGELCFKLNGDQSAIAWTQTLDEDQMPYPFTTHSRVYSTAALNCAGQPVGDDVSYTNTENETVIPPHNYGDGFLCTVCGHVNEEFCTLTDGYYQIGTTQQMDWFAAMVNGGHADISGRLTADIDWSETSVVMATGGNFDLGFMDGKVTDNDFRGTLDGQGHRLTVNIDHQSGGTALFAHIAQSGKVCNLIIDGTVCGTTGVGTFAWENWGTIENCISLVTVKTTANGFAAMGAMTCASHGGVVYKNCIFAGKLEGASATNTSGFNWSENGGNPTYENCVSAPAEVNVTGYDVWRQWAGNATYTNCYYVQAKEGAGGNGNAQLIDPSALASGELCFKLNGDQSVIAWTQTLDEDAQPFPFTTHSQVYSTAALNCAGQPIGDEVAYTNTENETIIPPHTFGDAPFCSVCGLVNENYGELKDGYYEIGTPLEMDWFAAMVNGGHADISGRLTADIDWSETSVVMATGGNFDLGFMDGKVTDNDFRGTLDGQGHRLTVNIDHQSGGTALFAHIATSGRVCNLIIDGTICGTTGVGTFAWENWGTIENCISLVTVKTSCNGFAAMGAMTCASHGGVVYRNCIFAGKLEGASATNTSGFNWSENGGNPTYENCVSAPAEVNVTGFDVWRQWAGNATYTNCYYVQAKEGAGGNGSAQLIDPSTLASGELCFKLNGDQSVIVWTQTLDEDALPYPFTTHSRVYSTSALNCAGQPVGEASYTNTEVEVVIPPHTFGDGFICSVCGALDTEYITPIDGSYPLATTNDVLWFCTMVNNGNTSMNAHMTADITVTFPDNVMIGVNGKDYKGTFDGQGHRLTATVNRTGDGCGLFASIASEGKVCNLVIDGTITGTTGTGSVAWQNFGTIENVLSLATVKAAGYSAGITCASVGSASYRNCIFAGAIDCGTASPVAGFSWWTNGGNPSYENCACIPQGVTAGGYFAWSEQDGNGTFTNCYYTDVNGTNRPGGAQLVDAANKASGELCYLLNQGAGEFIFFQGEAYPQFQGNYVAKVADNGYGTFFVADEAIAIPEGITAYTGKIVGDILSLTAVEGTIPAGTAVVLKGEPGFYAFAPADGADAIADNDLKGTTETTEANTLQYILAEVDGTVGFYQAVAGTYIPFAKAYLEIAADAGVKFIGFGDATGIDEMTTDNRQQTTVIYDLQGRRVVKAQKGIYIVNGKKVLK